MAHSCEHVQRLLEVLIQEAIQSDFKKKLMNESVVTQKQNIFSKTLKKIMIY